MLAIDEQDGARIVTLQGPDDLHDPVVTRLRDEHGVLVGARQQVYRDFSLSCDEVEIVPLPLARSAGVPNGRETCVRLPLDDGWLVATEYPVGPEQTCVVWATIGGDGGRSALSTECRTDLLADVSDRHPPERREHFREHLAEMAYSSGAGPSSPEAWFRSEDGDVRVLLNRFRGVREDRCLTPLPAPGETWRPDGCIPGTSLGP